jgi:phosphomannomutase
MSTQKLPVFKAYDLRGIMPAQLNPQLAYHIGRGLAATQPGLRSVVLGMDSRESSPTLLAAVAAGLATASIQVSSLGLCGTEEVYHAAGAGHADLGIMVTASHNPVEYNGMKLVKRGGHPFNPADDLTALEEWTRTHMHEDAPTSFPDVPQVSYRAEYVDHLFKFIKAESIAPQTIVINAGNGAAGPTADAVLAHLPQLKVIRVHHVPDGTFPNGIPNPLLPQNRASTANAVVANKAAIGIAWDGDFDRCFLYDENGNFVSNYYLAGLLAQAMLQQYPGSAIVHDPRLYWDTLATIGQMGGTPVIAKVGHGFIKPAMRAHNAVFAGEISGHFYFRDFFTCDTGMLPWLLVLQLLGQTRQTLGQAVAARASANPASDEINFHTPTPAKEYLATLQPTLATLGEVSQIDGITLTTPQWRANIRASSNEPLLRLNVEAKSPDELQTRLQALTSLIKGNGATLSDH